MANRENPADNFLNASKPPRLLEAVRDTIRLKHYSLRTEETDVHWIRRFIHFHGKRHPRELGATEVTAFLNHLVRNRDVAAATQTTIATIPASGRSGRYADRQGDCAQGPVMAELGQLPLEISRHSSEAR